MGSILAPQTCLLTIPVCDPTRARLIGVVLQDAVIDGLASNLVVNGVEVASYMSRQNWTGVIRCRLLIRSADPADLRQAHQQLQTEWRTTIKRLRELPEGTEHRRVGGEWWAVQTLRHLAFVHDSWFRRCCLGLARPFTAIGLASPFVPDQEEQGLDQAADPSLDDMLTVRDEQAAELEQWLATVTAAELSAAAPVPTGSGWPPYAAGKSVLQCLHVVLNEEREHHGFLRARSRPTQVVTAAWNRFASGTPDARGVAGNMTDGEMVGSGASHLAALDYAQTCAEF